MEEEGTSLKRLAHIAGLLYLISGGLAAFGIIYVSSQILVPGDISATIHNMTSRETLLRTGVASHIISTLLLLLLVLVLYRMLRSVNESKAKLMVAFVLVQVPIVFVIEILRMGAIMFFKGDEFKTIAPQELQKVVMLYMKSHSYGIMLLEMLWGLWLVPFGQLVFKSTFIPRALGILLVIAGIGYVIDSLTFILYPSLCYYTKLPALAFAATGEISIILWLLIRGVNQRHLSSGKPTNNT
jgi:hypothetical protein